MPYDHGPALGGGFATAWNRDKNRLNRNYSKPIPLTDDAMSKALLGGI